MTDLFAARAQMALSLGFHIIFAVVGMAMPVLMLIAELLHRRTGSAVYKALAIRWAKGTAIMFAVGAVSGTALSFELGLLWPGFMEVAGPIIGMPFSLEGFAFFLEAIFLGIYLYGREVVSARAHLLSAVIVAIAGNLSAIFVICANGWMNAPRGFTIVDGAPVAVDLWEAMWNPAALVEGAHMVVAALAAVGFAVAGIHALRLLRGGEPRLDRPALAIALAVGGFGAILTPVTGHKAAEQVAVLQPVKLAAMEGQWEDEVGAPLRIGGWPDEQAEVTRFAIEVPYALSLLATGRLDGAVAGLKQVPRADRPPVAVTHMAFQIMVACGSVMMGIAGLAGALALRGRHPADRRWLLKALVISAPLGMIAIEAGWTVTEVGRQPWVIQGLMRTSEAVTPMPHLMVPFLTFTALYVVLGAAAVLILRRRVFGPSTPEVGDADA